MVKTTAVNLPIRSDFGRKGGTEVTTAPVTKWDWLPF